MITINTEWVTYINIGVIILYVLFMVRGARRGVLVQILSSLGTIVSFLAAWRYCSFASGYYELWPKNLIPVNDIPLLAQALYSHINELIWFIALFAVFRLLFMILEKLCSGLSNLPVIKELSGFFGGVLGLVSATVWILVICVVLNMPFFINGKKVSDASYIGLISDYVSEKAEQFAGPVNASEAIGTLYEGFNEFDDQDMDMISEWLSEHGINPLDPEETDEPAAEENGTNE